MHIPIKNDKTLMLDLIGDLLNAEIVMAINSQIDISEKKLFKSNFSIIFIHHILLSIDKLSSHLENIPNAIPNININVVLIILFFNFKLLSAFLILFNKSLIFITLITIIPHEKD